MQSPEEARRQLLETFKVELNDHLNRLTKGLLALEQSQSPAERAAILPELFRSAHSLKGAARAVRLSNIETIAHRMEDVLDVAQQKGSPPGREIIDALLAAVDMTNEAMTAYQQNTPVPQDRLENLLARLHDADQGQTDTPPPNTQNPPADDAISSEQPVEALLSPPSPPPPAPSSPPTPALRHTDADDTIRVATDKLDDLMNNVGELLVMRLRTEEFLDQVKLAQRRMARWQKSWLKVRGQFSRSQRQSKLTGSSDVSALIDFLQQNANEMKILGSDLNNLASRLTRDRNYMQTVIEEVQTSVHHIRMLPLNTLLDLYPRMVRDIAHERGKEVSFKINGGEIQVDRQVIEVLKDPLTHLLRNAVDHGIESPAERAAASKPPSGSILLQAEQRGNNLVLQIRDDGQGISLPKMRQAAVQQGLVSEPEIASWSDNDIINLIFHPGFSTADRVTELSGRGIGLDVVRQALEQMQGLVEINTATNQGTSFVLTLPLTVATSQVLLVRVAGETVAIPMRNVERIVRVPLEKIGSVEGRPAIFAEGQTLPLISLARTLQLSNTEQPLHPQAKIAVLILAMAEKRLAARVEGLLSTQEVVVKNLGDQLQRVRNVTGATILGDGQIVIVLNVTDLFKTIQTSSPAAIAHPITTFTVRRRKILIVDDSITTRTLEKHILENAGFEVIAAADGREALEIIRNSENAAPDLVVSDINMPNMNGFELTETVKGDPRHAELPLVLVTSLESPQDRIRGLQAGADAYIVKSSFDQRELLETIERLIG